MNTYQSERQTSYRNIVRQAKAHEATVKLIPKFSKGIDKLDQIIVQIDKERVQQEKALTGITEAKNFTEDDLIELTIDVSGAVHSYADDKNNKDLMAKVNYKPSRIERMSVEELIAASSIVLEEAQKIPAADLAEEGISAEELAEYEEIVTIFKILTTTAREAIIARSVHTKKIASLFEEAGRLIKNSLDRLATQFKRKDRDFYLLYRGARNVIHRGPSTGNEEEKKTA
jgi:hypothetical protein